MRDGLPLAARLHDYTIPIEVSHVVRMSWCSVLIATLSPSGIVGMWYASL